MSGADEDRRRAARAEQAALFRYQLIQEAADPALTVRQRGRMVRELAGKTHEGPFGEPVTVSRATISGTSPASGRWRSPTRWPTSPVPCASRPVAWGS
jgi:hypothetical protein